MLKLEKISFSNFGQIIDRKEDDFCRKHQINFENECHLLPSGKSHWIGCPKCKAEIDTRVHIEKPVIVEEITSESKFTKAKGF